MTAKYVFGLLIAIALGIGLTMFVPVAYVHDPGRISICGIPCGDRPAFSGFESLAYHYYGAGAVVWNTPNGPPLEHFGFYWNSCQGIGPKLPTCPGRFFNG